MELNSLDFLPVTHLHVKECLYFNAHMGSRGRAASMPILYG
jgi:hypothetical protein